MFLYPHTQVFPRCVDNYRMDISNMTNLASIAADMKAASVREQISMAVVKQTLDQSKQQANSLLKMMYQSNVNVAPKGHIDLYM